MYVILCCSAVFCCLVSVGCRKKTQENKSVTPAAAPSAPAASTSPQSAPAASLAVDTEKPVPEVQAQAQTLNVEDLKAIALKYKQAILAKQAEAEKLITKVKEMPVTQALSQEATSLKTDLQTIQTSLKALKDRFQVYYNTLKEKGGSLAGLEL